MKTIKPESKKPYVIVRCRDAGVHAGYLVSQVGREVCLEQSRRCRRFRSLPIGDCSDLARVGLVPGSDSIIRPPVTGRHMLLDACEVIPCTEKAAESIREWPHG